jgi:ABC-2 type transport system ATP-binding protein
MKQRLGLASVLMKDPEVLVLDEPANGLDPAGIKEIRELIRSLGDEGRTVMVSSHILSEVQAICDGVAILAKGRSIAQGPVDSVLATSGTGAFVVRTPRLREARKVLIASGHQAVLRGDGSLGVVPSDGNPGSITRVLSASRIYLTELRAEAVSLESVFLEQTKESS